MQRQHRLRKNWRTGATECLLGVAAFNSATVDPSWPGHGRVMQSLETPQLSNQEANVRQDEVLSEAAIQTFQHDLTVYEAGVVPSVVMLISHMQ